MRVAAAIGATVIKPLVEATIVDGVTIDADGDMTVKALSEADAETQAIGLAFADDAKTTVGAAVAINVADLETTASVGDGTITTGSLSVEAGTPAGESSDFKVLAIAGSGSTQKGENENTAVAGAVGVNVVVSDTTASIADDATVSATAGNVDVLARQDVGIQNIAGGGALTLSDSGTSVGAAIGVAIGNIALGLPIGMCIGVAIGVAMDRRAESDEGGDDGQSA